MPIRSRGDTHLPDIYVLTAVRALRCLDVFLGHLQWYYLNQIPIFYIGVGS
jgi:hypothetical protein